MNNRDGVWRTIYVVGGTAAVFAVLIFRRYFSVEFMQFNGFGLVAVPDSWPGSAAEWLTLFQQNRIVAMVLFDLFDLVNYGLVGLIFLALYGALRDVAENEMRVALAIGFAGLTVYFASNQLLGMLRVNIRFTEATTDAERDSILEAAEALLAVHNPGALFAGPGIFLSLFLLLTAGLIISVVMLRSPAFNRATGIVGLLANGIGLGFFIAFAFIPQYGWLFPTISAPFRMVWYILIAIKLFSLAR